jgi:polyisoprenoid-binding protein YceI
MSPRLLAILLICFWHRAITAESPPLPADSVEIEFNPSKSTVQFTLGALLHIVHGSFKVKNGIIRFDPESGRASGQIAVDVRSGETGESARDRLMHESVLESNRFPDAVFSPDHVQGRFAPGGDSQLVVHGSLRMHGGEHDMTVPVNVKGQTDFVTATAKFAVPYVAWGMKDPSNLVLRVDKSVEVEVKLTGAVAARSKTSAVAHP